MLYHENAFIEYDINTFFTVNKRNNFFHACQEKELTILINIKDFMTWNGKLVQLKSFWPPLPQITYP